ncbi:MAG TPA: Gldg family protein, partial [Tepidisphaeraceae bacterium]|nr:Gldg family protein [Tepidisphaeraceae bacterium]
MSEPTETFKPETQKERWLKYGANVAFTIVIVIALASLIAYISQRFDRRIDTTTSRLYSLKPQTINLIQNQNQHIKLVSLYSPKDAQGRENAYAGPVSDLLEEYSRKGKNIEFDVIDPVTQPAKSDNLMSQAMTKYGGAVNAYKDFLQDFNKTYDQLKELVSAESANVASFKTDNLGQDQRGQEIAAIIDTVRDQLPQLLTRLKDQNTHELRKKFPDYKAVADQTKESLQTISQAEAAIGKLGITYLGDPKVPEDIRKYLANSLTQHDAIKKLADQTTKKIDSLGELKIGELQDAVKQPNVILVLGDNEWRVIGVDQVWVSDARDLHGYTEGQEIKPRFAGEQAVTSAILSLGSGKKPKVAFIRAGGAPLSN